MQDQSTLPAPVPDADIFHPVTKRCKASTGGIVLDNYTADPTDFDAEAEIERMLAIHEAQLAEACADPSQILIGSGPDCLIGFDSEYTNDPVTNEKKIVCVQLHLLAEGGELSEVFYSQAGERLPLVNCVTRLLLAAMGKNIVRLWPKRVILGAYFLRADLDSISEFQELKRELDSAGGRICTIGKAITYSLLPHAIEDVLGQATDAAAENDGGTALPRRLSAAISDNGRLRLLSLVFRDMAGFVAMGTALEDVGTQLGIEKVELGPDDDKARMDLVLKRDPVLFDRYARTDAHIVVKFMAETMLQARELTGSSDLPPTASALAQKFFLKTLQDAGLSREECLGVQKVKTAVWSERADRVRTITNEVPVAERDDHRSFVTKCYHGGMNMVMHSGPSEIDTWRDWDLITAYPSAMLSIREIDFRRPRVSTNVEDFLGDVLGFAHVEFAYPDSVIRPGLPVDGDTRGLLYPRTGRSYCTAPELAVAVRQGCQITVFHHGVLFPWKQDAETGEPSDIRIFEPFVREGRQRRARYEKGSAPELLIKLIMNSLYGRTAMGLKEKKVYDTRSGQSVTLPPSAITNEVIAAHVTGAIRATLVEILSNLPPGKRALSVTTDGFICNCTLEELSLDGVMAQRYMDWTERVTGRREILEEKHRVKQVVVMKTRGQITAERDESAAENKQTVLAKVGVSPPKEVPKSGHNEYMLDLYLNRHPGQRTTTRPFISVRDQWSTDAGFVRLEREQTLNLEPDWKNRLINPRMVKVRGMNHIACDSVPWETAEQGLMARAIFDGWCRKNTLRTLDDWAQWEEYYQFGLARRAKRSQDKPGPGLHMTREGAVGVLRRMFLRAWTREELGLTKTMSASKLAAWLTANRMKTSHYDVKNASRETHRFEEGVVPRTPEVLDLLQVLKTQFPEADLDRLLLPANLLPA